MNSKPTTTRTKVNGVTVIRTSWPNGGTTVEASCECYGATFRTHSTLDCPNLRYAMSRPAEIGTGQESVSKRLRARASKQWAETWGKELAEMDELEQEYARAAEEVFRIAKARREAVEEGK